MKKFLLSSLALAWACIGFAQTEIERVRVLDVAEDTTQVYTVTDIVEMQEAVSKTTSTAAHYSSVWGRKTFFNLGYNLSGSMNPEGDIPLGLPQADGENIPTYAPDFKIKWGAMLQLGHTYTLHKGAIANMVQINLDYTYIDLNVNHYGEESYANRYDGETNNNLPWASKKYDLTYGMTLGPSLTLAPFTKLNIPQLDYLKFNIYYHFGYHAGLLLMDQKDPSQKGINFDHLAWCHGLSKSFGLNLSWKSIGIGWETRDFSPTYKNLSGDSNDTKYKFKNKFSRIYLNIRY
ncbi:MAG: hypothetical protein K2N35_06450 [Muribaculaceae bacterium]|nr:hypothetical protein [Muribaculaceae bacterium]